MSISKLAYEVSYTTEYRNGRIETHDENIRYFASRDHAVAHAKNITGDAKEDNGVFAGEWFAPFASFFAPEDQEEIRVTATVQTVTINEIEESL